MCYTHVGAIGHDSRDLKGCRVGDKEDGIPAPGSRHLDFAEMEMLKVGWALM